MPEMFSEIGSQDVVLREKQQKSMIFKRQSLPQGQISDDK
jgi:hypothetical protein